MKVVINPSFCSRAWKYFHSWLYKQLFSLDCYWLYPLEFLLVCISFSQSIPISPLHFMTFTTKLLIIMKLLTRMIVPLVLFSIINFSNLIMIIIIVWQVMVKVEKFDDLLSKTTFISFQRRILFYSLVPTCCTVQYMHYVYAFLVF